MNKSIFIVLTEWHSERPIMVNVMDILFAKANDNEEHPGSLIYFKTTGDRFIEVRENVAEIAIVIANL